MEPEPQGADALGPQADGGREDEIDAVGLEEVRRADFGSEPLRDEAHDVHERLGWVGAGIGKRAELVERQHVVDVMRAG